MIREAQFNFRDQVWINMCRANDGKMLETAVYAGSDYDENLISVTNQIGCPVKCKFCLVADQAFTRNITPGEYAEQVSIVLNDEITDPNKPTKVSFTRAGEALLNPHTPGGIELIAERWSPRFKFTSTMPSGTVAQKIIEEMKGIVPKYEEFQFNVSMHTSDEDQRKAIIPYKNLMSFDDIAAFGKGWAEAVPGRTVNLCFAMMEDNTIDLQAMREQFNPDHFSIRFSLYLPCTPEHKHAFPPSLVGRMEKLSTEAESLGYRCIQSVARETERMWHTSPGSGMKLYTPKSPRQDSFLSL